MTRLTCPTPYLTDTTGSKMGTSWVVCAQVSPLPEGALRPVHLPAVLGVS